MKKSLLFLVVSFFLFAASAGAGILIYICVERILYEESIGGPVGNHWYVGLALGIGFAILFLVSAFAFSLLSLKKLKLMKKEQTEKEKETRRETDEK